jgi:hypothetical protein
MREQSQKGTKEVLHSCLLPPHNLLTLKNPILLNFKT